MPPSEHDPELEQLKEAIGRAKAAPEREASYEEMVSFYVSYPPLKLVGLSLALHSIL